MRAFTIITQPWRSRRKAAWYAARGLIYFTGLYVIVFTLLGCAWRPTATDTALHQADYKASLVRVKVTRQAYDLNYPWRPTPAKTSRGVGVILKDRQVLVTADMVANHRFIELERIGTYHKIRARLVVADYEANLALIQPIDPDVLANTAVMPINGHTIQGQQMSVVQVKENGSIAVASGPVTAVELGQYPYQNRFLVYRVNASLPYRLGNVTLPVVKAGKLAGLLKGYDTKSQTISVIPSPVIDHFIKDAANGDYQGFPLFGFATAPAEDPQLRRFERLDDNGGGVYIDRVLPESPAGKAGFKAGDILLSIGPHTIDARGQFIDPVYGSISAVHLRSRYQVGETADLAILRSGKALTIPLTFEHRDAQDYLIPPYLIDQPPRYFILGGLILQELTADHLMDQQNQKSGRRSWRLLYLYRYPERFAQGDLKKSYFSPESFPPLLQWATRV